MTLFNFVAAETHILPVYRNVGIMWHKELEGLWGSWKKANLGKQTKLVKEAAAKALAEGPGRRRESRVFFRQEVTNLVKIFTAAPGLIAPKINIFLAAMSRLYEEIQHYLLVMRMGIPKDVKKVVPIL